MSQKFTRQGVPGFLTWNQFHLTMPLSSLHCGCNITQRRHKCRAKDLWVADSLSKASRLPPTPLTLTTSEWAADWGGVGMRRGDWVSSFTQHAVIKEQEGVGRGGVYVCVCVCKPALPEHGLTYTPTPYSKVMQTINRWRWIRTQIELGQKDNEGQIWFAAGRLGQSDIISMAKLGILCYLYFGVWQLCKLGHKLNEIIIL